MLPDEKWTTKILWTDTQCKWPMGNRKDNSTIKWDTHIHWFQKGAKFEYGGKYYTAYDTVQRTWRHLNLFQYETYIHARVPRIKTDDRTKVVEVPFGDLLQKVF